MSEYNRRAGSLAGRWGHEMPAFTLPMKIHWQLAWENTWLAWVHLRAGALPPVVHLLSRFRTSLTSYRDGW